MYLRLSVWARFGQTKLTTQSVLATQELPHSAAAFRIAADRALVASFVTARLIAVARFGDAPLIAEWA